MRRWCAFRTIEGDGEADGAFEYNAYYVTRKPNATLLLTHSSNMPDQSGGRRPSLTWASKSLVFPAVLPSSWHLDFDERCDITAHFTLVSFPPRIHIHRLTKEAEFIAATHILLSRTVRCRRLRRAAAIGSCPCFSSVIRKEAKVPRRTCLYWASIDQDLDTTRKRSLTDVKIRYLGKDA